MKENDLVKIKRNFMLTPKCISKLNALKEYVYPELSLSQIVERAILEFARSKNIY